MNFFFFLSIILYNIYCCVIVEVFIFELLYEFYLIFVLIVLGSFYVFKLKFYYIVLCLIMKINLLIKLIVKWFICYLEVLVCINYNKIEINWCKINGLYKYLLVKYCKMKESKFYNLWINNFLLIRVVYFK